jgi:flagellar L-ring protein precursor FlgH
MRRLTLTLGLTAGLGLLLSGCETMPKPVKVDFAEARPAPLPMVAAPRPASGSLFQAVSYRPAFEDPRARNIGDTITIQIVENVTASQVSKSTSNRSTSMDAGISAAPLISAMDIANLKVGAASTNDFSGKGGTESANTFAGTITATVVEVLANGHMVVMGEKQIGVNQNVDVLRFSGTVDPKAVQPGNVVSSNKVANARMESRGRGAQAEAQTVGLLTRFFFSFLPF